jgi:lipopolysaccharide export system permease protein
LPWLVMLIIPISLFIAVLITYDRMLANNELTILKNSGLSKFQLAKPVIWMGIFCCLICYLMSFYLMPMANKKLRLARSNFQHNYANIMISPGIFEDLNNLTIYVKNRNSKSELSGIIIYDNRNPDYSLTVTAKSGNLGESNDSVLLYLNNGTVQKYNYPNRKSEILRFDNYVVNLSDNDTKNESQYIWKAKERYINELLYPDVKSEPKDLAKFRAELHHRLVYPTFSLVLALIAVAFILNGQFRRGNVINNITAIIVGTVFIVSIMVIYDILEKSIELLPLLYLDLAIFLILCLNMLRSKSGKATF